MVYSIYQQGAECIFHINDDILKSSCVAGACGDFFGLVLCPTVYPLLMQPFTEISINVRLETIFRPNKSFRLCKHL